MKPMSERELFKKYPKIFRQKNLSMKETCMCWGLEIGPGWYPLIDIVCSYTQNCIDKYKLPQLEATQVKEKFGGLRFYFNWYKDNPKCKLSDEEIKKHISDIDQFIDSCECISNYICETCGTVVGVSQTEGWIVTLCQKCMVEYKKRRELK